MDDFKVIELWREGGDCVYARVRVGAVVALLTLTDGGRLLTPIDVRTARPFAEIDPPVRARIRERLGALRDLGDLGASLPPAGVA